MALYKCRILDSVGCRHTVMRESGDIAGLKAELRAENKVLLKASVVKAKEPNTFFAVRSRVKPSEVVLFLRQFAVMVRAAVPIDEALNALRGRRFTKVFQKVLTRVYADVQSGVLLSEAFGRHKKVFPRFFVGMVAVGEASGSLGTVLCGLADYYENDRKLRRKAASSLVYPTLLLFMLAAVFFFLTVFVIPRFEDSLSLLGGELPALTKAVMAVSVFVRGNVLYIIAAIAAAALIMALFGRTQKGRYAFDYLKLHLPFVGTIQRNLITSRFAKAFVVLLESGMVVSDALENLIVMLGNAVFEVRFKYSVEEVKRGRTMAAAIESTRLFPAMLIKMINVGERSGRLTDVLRSSGAYFEGRVESSVAKAISLLEPSIIVIMGLVVGIVISAIFLPEMALVQSM